MPPYLLKDSTMADPANRPDGEAEVIDKLVSLLVSRQRATAPQLRGMHPKTVACLTAEFRVSDAVPAPLAHGVFAKPQTYTAWVRLSNAVTWDDREPDIHGLAIKLLGVPGALLPDPQGESDAQDILLIDMPVFFAPDVPAMYGFLSRKFGLEQAGKSAEEVGRVLAAECPRATELFVKFAGPARPPLEIGYWSCVPYRLGPHVAKYHLRPMLADPPAGRCANSPNGAREATVEWLTTRARPAYFDLYVQLQEDPVTMPVEDATVEWGSPFHKVAELTIPPQTFDTPERDALGERLSFDPWRTLPDHAPLGSLNRARKPAYWSSVKLRRGTNTADGTAHR
jgi:hypothetical protein